MNTLTLVPMHLTSYALSLEELGLADVAWPVHRIGEVLNALKDAGVAILGGDVYENDGGLLRATYDNWHCERLRTESLTEYTRRSWQQAWEYTHTYPRNPMKALYFVLVVSNEETAGMQ